MNATLLVGIREFRQRVRSRGFILSTLAVPLMLMVVWVVTGSPGFAGDDETPLQEITQRAAVESSIGFVDQASLIEEIPDEIPPGQFRSFSDQESAALAMRSGEVEAFYVIPADYRETGAIQRVSSSLPLATPDMQMLDWILVRNLFPDLSSAEIAGLRWPFHRTGLNFVSLSAETGPSTGEGITTDSMLPFLAAMAVMIPLFTSGGYLLQSLAQEKSSRIMEILLVSLKPNQLLSGKLLGLGGLAIVQYAAWAVVSGAALTVTGRDAAETVGSLNLSLTDMALVVPYALGGFVLYAALMAGMGAMSPDTQSSRSWVFVISLPMLIPVYLWTAIASAPNGLLAIILSLIPFSAPTAMLMRLTSTSVAGWQIAASLLLLLGAAVVTVRLMARLFRVQTLLSGKSLSMRRIWETLKS